MFKKLALTVILAIIVVIILLLILAQGVFIYAIQHGGSGEFTAIWNGFGITQTGYSKFVFRTIEWWWGLPVLCLLLTGIALWRPRVFHIVLALLASVVGTIALCWSAYAPALFVL